MTKGTAMGTCAGTCPVQGPIANPEQVTGTNHSPDLAAYLGRQSSCGHSPPLRWRGRLSYLLPPHLLSPPTFLVQLFSCC